MIESIRQVYKNNNNNSYIYIIKRFLQENIPVQKRCGMTLQQTLFNFNTNSLQIVYAALKRWVLCL